jgi:hypothetical protein
LAAAARDAATASWYRLPKPHLPIRQLVFDRDYSRVSLPEYGMQGNSKDSLQTFYTWVQRLDIVPRCARSFVDATAGPNGRLVIARPGRELTPADLRRLDDFFARGGKLLVIDGPSTAQSTVNLLLERYGLSIDYRPAPGGVVRSTGTDQPPAGVIQPAFRVDGGDAVALAGELPVVVRTRVRNGELWACGLADVWSDASLGNGNAPVNAQQKFWSDLEYWTIRKFMDETSPGSSAGLSKPAQGG